MTSFPTVRVAAVQATPVILDADASVDKAVRLIGEAAEEGAQLVVLPEVFVSLYPSNVWGKAAASFGGNDELWERFWESSADVPGPHTDRLVAACAEHGVHVVIGVNERESERPGSVYNTMLTLGPEGILHKHRKLMPTMQERLFHGIGPGDDLGAVQKTGPQIWVALTSDDTDGWLASMRYLAIESRAFVVSVPQYIPASAFPADFPAALPEGKEVFGNGGATIIEPTAGNVIAGPLYGAEGTLYADCDLRIGLHAKRWFDSVGHYSREDVLGHGMPAGADGNGVPARPIPAQDTPAE